MSGDHVDHSHGLFLAFGPVASLSAIVNPTTIYYAWQACQFSLCGAAPSGQESQDRLEQRRSKRWSKACVSVNLDADYAKFVAEDYDHAFSYVCFCPPSSATDEEDDDRETASSADEEPEDSAEDIKSKSKCDGGKKCFCQKSPADHSGYPWVASRAGVRKFTNQRVHADIRCPDFFDMYVYNDFAGFGLVEVAQNLVFDFVEAEGDWKEQWAVCKAASLSIMGDMFMPITQIEDGDLANDTFCLLMAMFLTMLHKLGS
ncbi:hypothetical protein BDV32DRAFT_144075 [Aspergillus pseudonomiae]|nr:hypothetical protein BDV32DRAFT_144075 [Aspergillus pseudonomiae]